MKLGKEAQKHIQTSAQFRRQILCLLPQGSLLKIELFSAQDARSVLLWWLQSRLRRQDKKEKMQIKVVFFAWTIVVQPSQNCGEFGCFFERKAVSFLNSLISIAPFHRAGIGRTWHNFTRHIFPMERVFTKITSSRILGSFLETQMAFDWTSF